MIALGLARRTHSCHRSGRTVVRSAVAALLAALAVTVAACGRKEAAVATQAGPYRLTTQLAPDPPRQGANTLRVAVEGAEGKVEAARVRVGASMPAMGAMAAMRAEAEVAEEAPGVYRAEFDLPMSGSWTLDVEVAAPAGSAEASYRLTIGQRGLQPVSTAATTGVATSGALPMQHFSPSQLDSLREALAAYGDLWRALAADRLADLAAPAERLAAALGRVDRDGLSGELPQVLDEATRVARSLAGAATLGEARAAFGETSRLVMLVANCDARVGEGWHAFSCPMTETFPKWIQPADGMANPYMGRTMSTCGETTDWSVPPLAKIEEVRAHGEHAHGAGGEGDEVSFWTCSMHTTVRSDRPGTCPICSMDLVPVTREEVETGIIFVDPQRRQTIGVRTGAVERRRVTIEVRAVGKVAFDETRLTDVSVKYPGWIGRLEADATGQAVRRGQTLFTLYSPELYAAQEEFLTVLRSQQAARETAAPDRADYLVEAARQRLRLWDLTEAQIDQIAESGKAAQYLPIVSPVSGYVIEKDIVEGGAVEAGMRLYRIAALDRVWIEAEVYESELSLIHVGQEARVTLPYLPGEGLVGRVAFIYPYLDNMTRTGRVRIELPNRGLELKPDMYADVTLQVDRGERLVVVESAVLYAGPRRLVFLDLGEGRLKPQPIEVGVKSGDFLEVLSGLDEGDVVVTSGTFLIAAESRLKSATEQWQ